MMDALFETDLLVFYAINHLPHTFATDWFALMLSGVGFGGLIWIILGIGLFLREERRDHRFFIPIGVAIGASWILVDRFLKYVVARPRPTAEIGAIIVGKGAEWYAFPSSHATVSAAMAIVLSRFEPRWRAALYLLAALIALSRVYLGVHYPSDVIAGALLGVGIGKLAVRFIAGATD